MAPTAAPSWACGSAGCRAAGTTPRPIWNPDIEQPIKFFEGWQEVPDTTTYDNAFKIQWEEFLKHVVVDTPFPWTLREGAKGVQLAELGLQSWEQRKWLPVEPVVDRLICTTELMAVNGNESAKAYAPTSSVFLSLAPIPLPSINLNASYEIDSSQRPEDLSPNNVLARHPVGVDGRGRTLVDHDEQAAPLRCGVA